MIIRFTSGHTSCATRHCFVPATAAQSVPQLEGLVSFDSQSSKRGRVQSSLDLSMSFRNTGRAATMCSEPALCTATSCLQKLSCSWLCVCKSRFKVTAQGDVVQSANTHLILDAFYSQMVIFFAWQANLVAT